MRNVFFSAQLTTSRTIDCRAIFAVKLYVLDRCISRVAVNLAEPADRTIIVIWTKIHGATVYYP